MMGPIAAQTMANNINHPDIVYLHPNQQLS